MFPNSFPANNGAGGNASFASLSLDETSGLKNPGDLVNLNVDAPPVTGTSSGIGSFISGISGPAGSQSRMLLVVLALLIGFVSVIHVLGESSDPIENLVVFISNFFAEENAPIAPVAEGPARVKEELVPPPFSTRMVPNPYWILSVELGTHPTPIGPVWQTLDRERWRLAMNHPYNFQHYKSIVEVRKNRLMGSHIILFAGLDEPKFWSRMESAMGLAEFGYRLEVDTMTKAIGDARPDLINNYLQRFRKGTTPGELFVLKQMIRLVPAKARRTILEIVSKSQPTAENRLYLAAATYDPSPLVQSWVGKGLERYGVTQKVIEDYQKLVIQDYMGGGSTAVRAFPANQVNRPETVETVREGDAAQDVVIFSGSEEGNTDSIGDGSEVLEDDGFNDLLDNTKK